MTVQPAALVRGLARSLPPAVEIFEGSPVGRIRRLKSGFEVAAGSARLVCRRLFLAANGYTPGLGFLRHRASPRWSFGSLTRPLTAAEQRRLGGQTQWGVLACDPAGSTVRRTSDQRILIRNTFHYTPELGVSREVRDAARERHRTAFLARFPGLRDVPFEYTWSGLYGVSGNGQPFFGELGPNLFTAAVFNFAGLAMGTAAGRLLADLPLGMGSPLVEAARAPTQFRGTAAGGAPEPPGGRLAVSAEARFDQPPTAMARDRKGKQQ